jgi:hypothetical protein
MLVSAYGFEEFQKYPTQFRCVLWTNDMLRGSVFSLPADLTLHV